MYLFCRRRDWDSEMPLLPTLTVPIVRNRTRTTFSQFRSLSCYMGLDVWICCFLKFYFFFLPFLISTTCLFSAFGYVNVVWMWAAAFWSALLPISLSFLKGDDSLSKRQNWIAEPFISVSSMAGEIMHGTWKKLSRAFHLSLYPYFWSCKNAGVLFSPIQRWALILNRF